jgi:integrating conjugative element membrane protein (TIGR03747 family)
LLGAAGALVAAVCLATGASVVIECAGIALGWWPADHAMTLLATERAYIEAIDRYPLTALSPQRLSDTAAREVDGLWHTLLGAGGRYGTASLNTVKLLLLRLAICLCVLPGFLVVALVAFYDGLVARDIRKYTGEHESSYVFHKAKRWITPSLVLTVSVYLMLPFSLRPVVIFAPAMLLTGLMIYVAASRFKKFL